LAQVYGIVKQHGGEIDVHSEQGAGTTFTIYLPQMTPSVRRPRADHKKQVSAQRQETILLVEDNELAREAICDALEMLGYRMLSAATGSEALTLFASGRREIDLVLSDIYMPEMGGVELYRRLVEMSPEVKMMLMTGYPREGEGRSILEEGRVAWIRKPFSREEIGAKIRAVLGDGRAN
jgi:CheY-like chemotaxis protein